MLYLPKAIVSGDFFWFSKHEAQNKIVFATIDCTGHGVPGAFMSVMAHDLLDRIINQLNCLSPAEILNQLHRSVVKTLRSDVSTESVLDGMDMGLCVLNTETNELEFSGANIPLILIDETQTIQLIKGDAKSIGGTEQKIEDSFSTRKMKVKVGDQLYISSDGFKDQFGGEKGKKMNRKRFLNLLSSNSQYSNEIQKDLLLNYFLEWKGGLEQLDDICIVGVKITEELKVMNKADRSITKNENVLKPQ